MTAEEARGGQGSDVIVCMPPSFALASKNFRSWTIKPLKQACCSRWVMVGAKCEMK